MKKYLWILSSLTALAVSAIEPIKITGFEPDDKAVIRGNFNCKVEPVEAGVGETIPDGKWYLKVTLGGLNDQQGGGVVVPLPPNIPDDVQAISFWLKGKPENTFGPVIMFGDWCWMGMRFEKKAEVAVNEGEWIRHELKLKDFVPALSRKPQGEKKLSKYQHLFIQLGPAQDHPTSSVFFIDKIEIR